MTKSIVDPEKMKYLNGLLNVYAYEVEIIYAVGVSWKQLKDAAKDKCATDFDEALIARETLLEELTQLKSAGLKDELFDARLRKTDQELLGLSSTIKEIYSFDIPAYLNIKQSKSKSKPK